MGQYVRKTNTQERFKNVFGNTKAVGAFFTLVFLLALPVTVLFLQQKQITNPHAAGVGMPHVVSNLIVDANNNPFALRGAQVEMLNIAGYNQTGTTANQTWTQFPTTVRVMHDQWYMNAVRLPTCNWMWDANPTQYMQDVQTAVQDANSAGLYVILENHDDHRCNPPYQPEQETWHLPRATMTVNGTTYQGVDVYMQALAQTFKDNPMVIFDAYNEPNEKGQNGVFGDSQWQIWRDGGQELDPTTNTMVTYLGMQQVLNAIRSTGAQQMIMVEGYQTAETWQGIQNGSGYFVKDTLPQPNIVYEVHKYSIYPAVEPPQPQWDTDFGFLTQSPYNLPVFVGEWALMLGDNSGAVNCDNLPAPQAQSAAAAVQTFLTYMEQHNMGWTAYSFIPEHLIYTDTTGNYYAPTTIASTFTCPGRGNNVINHQGMGALIQQYLFSHQPTPTLPPTNTPTPSPTDTPTPTPSPSPIPLPTATPTPVQNAVTVVGMNTVSGTFNGKGINIKMPTVQQGDLLLIAIGVNGSPHNWSQPSGWSIGVNSNARLGMIWLWKVATQSDSNTFVQLKSDSYSDGGAVVVAYRGISPTNPIQAVSSLAVSNNNKVGKVSSALVNGVSWNSTASVTSVILSSWQPNTATVTWPSGYVQQVTATDGYGFILVGANIATQHISGLGNSSLVFSKLQSTVQTLQIALRTM